MTKVKIGCAAAALLLITVAVQVKEPEAVKVTPMIVAETIIEVPPAPYVEPVPSVTLYDIPLSEELQEYTYETCEKYLVGNYYDLVLAVMWQESTFDASTISKTNDYGLMQINKVNHKWLREKLSITDFLDPQQNIEAGVFMLSSYLLKYENVNRALMSYNMGEGGARKRWKQGIHTTNYTDLVGSKYAKMNEYIIE